MKRMWNEALRCQWEKTDRKGKKYDREKGKKEKQDGEDGGMNKA